MEIKLIVGFLILCLNPRCLGDSFGHKIGINESTRIFSPRMDYDEWTPLGRGDPLKNDPTFDYVPPVLDRVQYWLGDTQTSTESSSKRDVLVLGVTAKKTSPKIPEHYLKFMEAPKYHQESQAHSSYMARNDFTGSTGAEPPKIIRNTKFRSGSSSMDFRINNKGYYTGYLGNEAYYSEKPKPYTMMLPPPFNSASNSLQFAIAPNLTKKSSYVSNDHPTTSSSISFEKSNLIYHQSSHQALDWPSISPYQRPIPHSSPLLTWPSKEDDHFEIDHHHAAASMNHEVVVGQNANIIVDAGDNDEDKEEIVVGQKPTMQVILANASSTTGDSEDQKNVTVSVVMPTNYKDESTTKSSFTKPSTKMIPQFVEMSSVTPPFVSSTTMMPELMEMSWQQDQAPPPMMPPVRFPPKIHRRPSIPHRPPFVMQKPPGLIMMMAPEGFRPTTHRPSPLSAILRKEEGVKEIMMTTSTTTTTTMTTTTTTPATTTSVSDSFTTDPIFSHYKQPSAPLHGPMYLIIQGHSKVKTYKPIINKHGVPVETTSRPISKFEQFVNENTRREIDAKTTTEKIEDNSNGTKSGPDSLVNLVEKGFSAFTIPED